MKKIENQHRQQAFMELERHTNHDLHEQLSC